MAHDGTAHPPTLGKNLGQSSSLSPWAGPYVTDMLGKGAALSAMPYQAYQGPLTAGQSGLQGQAFQGLANLAVPTATTAGSFTAPGMAQQYMNPYLEGALAPQMAAAQRQADIQQQQLQSQYGKAGAYGGGRQAIAEAELQRGLLDRMSGITGQGYEQAYNQASNLFNQDRGYGLQALQGQMNAGTTQRGIESEGIAADIAQFETERDYPYKQVQYQQSLLQGLPITTQDYQYAEPTGLANFGEASGSTMKLLETLGFKFN